MTNENTNKPVIFWHSDPVLPNETLVISGEFFQEDAVVEIVRTDGKGTKKTSLKPIQQSSTSLKVVIPGDWSVEAWKYRVVQESGRSSEEIVNNSDVWWVQGDGGLKTSTQDGWVRVFGKCLAFSKKTSIWLTDKKKKKFALKVDEQSGYSLKAIVPAKLAAGKYDIVVDNGIGGQKQSELEVLEKDRSKQKVLNVLDFGADPTGKKDCTVAIVQAIELISSFAGGVIYFPRGRYRIDSILRSGTFIKSPLKVPEGITLRGEGVDLVSLWWPDQEEPLPTLIEGGANFGVEELSIYTQGNFCSIITGESNTKIHKVRIRASRYYMAGYNGGPHHGRKFEDVDPSATGAALQLWGRNIQVTDCDILTSSLGLDLRHPKGAYIAGNTIEARNFHFFNGGDGVIFENNSFHGCENSGGCNLGLHMGAQTAKHYYYAYNKTSNTFRGDREGLTLDGHCVAYTGHIKSLDACTIDLPEEQGRASEKGVTKNMDGLVVYILAGKGRGQYRWVKNVDGSKVTLDEAWLSPPDETSLISIAGYNGRHLFIGNEMIDTGTMLQLYPPNCECIAAGNKAVRASNINSLSKLGKKKDNDFWRVEQSWYNQFIENEYVVGNGWGAGATQIDRWIGGETCLNIWGWQVHYYTVDGADYDEFLPPEVLKGLLKEDEARQASIPLSLFQIIRRHKVHNNSYIRVQGCVSDVLIEGCELNNTEKGVVIDAQIDYEQPDDLGQLFDFTPETVNEDQVLRFLSPESVLVRNNAFDNVTIPMSGTALESDKVHIE